MDKKQSAGMYIVLAIIAMIFISSVFMAGPVTNTQEISYSDFLQKLDNGEFKKIEKADEYLIAIPKNQPESTTTVTTEQSLFGPVEKKVPQNQYKVLTPKDSNLMQRLEDAKVDIEVKKPNESSQLLGILGTLVFPLLLIGFLLLMIKSIQAGGSQAMSFGKSKAKMLLDSKVKTTFKDVAGIDEEKHL